MRTAAGIFREWHYVLEADETSPGMKLKIKNESTEYTTILLTSDQAAQLSEDLWRLSL